MALRERDLVWDEMERLFGVVVSGTNAHKKRNKAVKDLKLLGATPESITFALRSWPKLFNTATCTDIALATHYPQLTASMRKITPPCPECEMGGGMHVVGCSRAGVT